MQSFLKNTKPANSEWMVTPAQRTGPSPGVPGQGAVQMNTVDHTTHRRQPKSLPVPPAIAGDPGTLAGSQFNYRLHSRAWNLGYGYWYSLDPTSIGSVDKISWGETAATYLYQLPGGATARRNAFQWFMATNLAAGFTAGDYYQQNPGYTIHTPLCQCPTPPGAYAPTTITAASFEIDPTYGPQLVVDPMLGEELPNDGIDEITWPGLLLTTSKPTTNPHTAPDRTQFVNQYLQFTYAGVTDPPDSYQALVRFASPWPHLFPGWSTCTVRYVQLNGSYSWLDDYPRYGYPGPAFFFEAFINF
jgi:hypothetical protein